MHMNIYYRSFGFFTKLIAYFMLTGLLFACGGGGGQPPAPTPTPVSDTTPDTFNFTDQSGVGLSIVVVSDSITVSGINMPTNISITGGEYAINGGAFTSSAGTVNSGDNVSVRLTSADMAGTQTEVVLDIGGVTDAFSVITETQIGLTPISNTILSWTTDGFESCEIVNNQNSDVIVINSQDLTNGRMLHFLPSETVFTLNCTGTTGLGITDTVESTSFTGVEPFPETVGYYGSDSSTNNFWAAIVNLTAPISYTDRVDFNNQVDTYCNSLGYIGVVKTRNGDFATNDSYYLQAGDGIISGNGPSGKITLIPGDLSFGNVYTNRRNIQSSNGNVGVAIIGNNASSINRNITSPTSGTNQMVLCQTNIRLSNSAPKDNVVSFVEPGPITLVNGLDTTFTNTLEPNSPGNGQISYTSSDPAIATVDEATGVVTVIALGTTTISGVKAASPVFREAQSSYELTVRAPLPVSFISFTKTSDLTLGWETTGAASCEITNDQNNDVVVISNTELANGNYLHNLPVGTIFTLTCIAENNTVDSIVTSSNVVNNLFPETVGYYGSVSSTNNSWAAIVNLTAPISFTDRVDFNNQVDTYCSSLGYIGVVKTRNGDFATNDSYYLQVSDGIIGGNGPTGKITLIPGDLSFDNVYTNRRNTQSSNGNVGRATIGNDTSSINQSVPSPTTGVNQMVLCQTTIRLSNSAPKDNVVSFVEPGPITLVNGLDTTFTNTLVPGSLGTGQISYTSSDPAVATVDETTGVVTVIALGTTTISGVKTASLLFREAQDTYELTVRSPQALNVQSFEKTSEMTLAWQVSAAVSCDITNDQNAELFSVNISELNSGIFVHQLPGGTQFTLTCTGETGTNNSVVASAMTTNLYPETVGYYGSANSELNSWSAIVNLITPITFDARLNFNNQVDSYCTNLGYIGAVKTRQADFSANDTYFLQNTDGIIAGNGPNNKVTRIVGGNTFTNIYTNRRNIDTTNGNVGVATIGNNASSIMQGASSPTTGANQMVLCQTRIPTGNTFSEDIVISFNDPGPVNAVFGVDNFISNAIVGISSGDINYSSSDTGVATVNSIGGVTIRGVGTTTITAVREADIVVNEASASYVLNVTAP